MRRVAPADPEQRRLGKVHVAGLDQRPHEAEHQGQQQGADVRAVDVGVGHHDDLVIPQLGDVEVVMHPGAERGDDRLHLVVLQDPVDPGLLDVQDLAADRQDRLDPRVATTLGRAAGRVTLDDEDLALVGVGRLAVRQFAGQPAAARAGPFDHGPRPAPCGPRSARWPPPDPCG